MYWNGLNLDCSCQSVLFQLEGKVFCRGRIARFFLSCIEIGPNYPASLSALCSSATPNAQNRPILLLLSEWVESREPP
jgi:hypothetical protein